MNQLKDKPGALSPYLVLDLTDEKGFFCGKLLGDLGADVIKIEKPGGDPSRSRGPFFHDSNNPERSLYWFAFNSNKRGITLDIESTKGQDLFKRLVGVADFLIESATPGHMDKLGLGYPVLSAVNPRLIMTSITPFGQTGPKSSHKACELTCWASGAAMYCCGYPNEPPLNLSMPHPYQHGGSEAAAASMIAHYHRELTGEGQYIDVSIQESVIGTLMETQEAWALQQFNFRRSGQCFTFTQPDGGTVRQRYCFPCKDGWIAAYALGGGYATNVKNVKTIAHWMDEHGMAPEWLKDFDWVHDYETRVLTQEKIDTIEGLMTDFYMTKSKKELYEGALTKGAILAPVSNPRDILESEQLEARGFWAQVKHPELGEDVTYCGPWAKFSETPVTVRRGAPLVGEHNAEVYGDLLGLSQSEIQALTGTGVI